jgi:hypothetical protein
MTRREFVSGGAAALLLGIGAEPVLLRDTRLFHASFLVGNAAVGQRLEVLTIGHRVYAVLGEWILGQLPDPLPAGSGLRLAKIGYDADGLVMVAVEAVQDSRRRCP